MEIWQRSLVGSLQFNSNSCITSNQLKSNIFIIISDCIFVYFFATDLFQHLSYRRTSASKICSSGLYKVDLSSSQTISVCQANMLFREIREFGNKNENRNTVLFWNRSEYAVLCSIPCYLEFVRTWCKPNHFKWIFGKLFT